MKNILVKTIVTSIVLSSLIACSNKDKHTDNIVSYQTPGAEKLQQSIIYNVTVKDQNLTVFESTPPLEKLCINYNCDGADNARKDKRSTAWTQFSFAEQASFTVKKNKVAGALSDIFVRPRRTENIDYKIIKKDLRNATITVQVLKPSAKLSIEYIDDRYHKVRELPLDGLMIFTDPLESKDLIKAPDIKSNDTYVVKYGESFDHSRANKATAVYFEAGVHELGYWEVPESVIHVYLAGGAYVKGAINSAMPYKRYQKGFKVTGRGIVSGEAFPWRADKRQNGIVPCINDKGEAIDCWFNTVKLLQVGTDQYYVDGVTFVNAPSYVITGFKDDNIVWNSNDGYGEDAPEKDPIGDDIFTEEAHYSGTLNNFKVLGNWRWNGDGAAIHANSTIKNCFISAFDDAFKTYSTNGKVRDCVIWQGDNGAIFQFGWYAKDISNLEVENLDIIHAEQTGRNQNAGIFNFADRGYNRVDPASRKSLDNSTFKNIWVEGPLTRIVGLENKQVKNQSFRNITFENIFIERLINDEEILTYAPLGNGAYKPGSVDWRGLPVVRPSSIINDSGEHGEIKNIVFKNLVIGGTKVTNANAKSVGLFTIIGAKDQVHFH
ncbi:hypothetical protein [Catenovulum maritimum]|uniref:Glycoside hydrolase family 49 N-terminal domain-containing protein n=1 Tax=Catenovulum maritimum TaxID=1513271 RepID=A0A0J8GUL6_9ALTE|nr:hypothetical protein [Catenovulum maritimum]KMT66442.1 hypothetical protein XM47_02545 [Catenovulum maritimum]